MGNKRGWRIFIKIHLASKFASIDELLNCNFEQLVTVEDVGPYRSNKYYFIFTDKDNRSNIRDLLSSGYRDRI